jgi:hypothetical protein
MRGAAIIKSTGRAEEPEEAVETTMCSNLISRLSATLLGALTLISTLGAVPHGAVAAITASYWVQIDYEYVITPDGGIDDGLNWVTFMGEPIPDPLDTPYPYVDMWIPRIAVNKGFWSVPGGFTFTGQESANLTAKVGSYELASEFTPEEQIGPDIVVTLHDDLSDRDVVDKTSDYVWVLMSGTDLLARDDSFRLASGGFKEANGVFDFDPPGVLANDDTAGQQP